MSIELCVRTQDQTIEDLFTHLNQKGFSRTDQEMIFQRALAWVKAADPCRYPSDSGLAENVNLTVNGSNAFGDRHIYRESRSEG
jgi:hypothetical protein